MGMIFDMQTGKITEADDIVIEEQPIEIPVVVEQPILSLEELTTVVLDLQQQVEILGGTN